MRLRSPNGGLTPTVYSQAFVEALGETGVGFDLHVKIDTGMHRVGVGPAQLDGLMAAVAASPTLEVAALWTHFPVADEDSEYTMRQIERFDEVVSGYDVPMVHLANTAGAVLFPDARRSLVRVGLGTYGLHPCEETRDLIDLSPAMRIVSHVSHVQRLEAGARPSYGRIRPLAASVDGGDGADRLRRRVSTPAVGRGPRLDRRRRASTRRDGDHGSDRRRCW